MATIINADDRGRIQNRNRKRQIISFEGIRYGNITPTDTDGLLEFNNEAWVGFEAKHGETPVPYGQKLAFERLNDDLEQTGKPCIFIIATHTVDDPNDDIDAANTVVREYRFHKRWIKPQKTYTTKQMIDAFLIMFNIGNAEYSNLP